MAKNNHSLQTNQYANRDEQIRKAKGNPNKNIHKGKKNSNYRGSAAGDSLRGKLTEKVSRRERIQLSRWQKIVLGVDLVLLLVLLVLRLAVYQDNLLLANASTFLLGLTCAFLFYIRQFNHKEKTGFYKGIQVLLAVIAVLYCVVGFMGFLMSFGVIS